MRRLLPLLLLGACYRVQLQVEPASALVFLDEQSEPLGVPALVRVRPPGRRVLVEAPGHRALDVRLPWRPMALVRRRPTVQLLMVEDHGPAGSAP